MDTLSIESLSIYTHIGVYPWEKRILQQLKIDISLSLSIENCNDNIANSIDYDELSKKVITFVQNNHFDLIETVAEQIAQLLKEQFSLAQVTIRVSKPHAISQAANVSICITR